VTITLVLTNRRRPDGVETVRPQPTAVQDAISVFSGGQSIPAARRPVIPSFSTLMTEDFQDQSSFWPLWRQ